VLAAGEGIYPKAFEHGLKLLPDPAMVTTALEEVAAMISRLVKSKDSPCDPMLVRDLRAYLFQAFLRHVNHLKRASRNAVEAFRLTWTYPHIQR
jgi:hypothetical protein